MVISAQSVLIGCPLQVECKVIVESSKPVVIDRVPPKPPAIACGVGPVGVFARLVVVDRPVEVLVEKLDRVRERFDCG